MDRKDILLEGLSKSDFGLEVAPWHNPLAPKSEGWTVTTIDVFGTDEMRARAANDPLVSDDALGRIEPVDFVGSACDIAEIVPQDLHSSFDWILSSHNFEHLPDPLKFLQGAETLLGPSGKIILALPDKRGCFDYFRPVTVIGDWIEARFEERIQPSARQIFELNARQSKRRLSETEDEITFRQYTNPADVNIVGDLKISFEDWASGAYQRYMDTHCSIFTPSSFELLMFEARVLGLTRLEVEDIIPTKRHEFLVRLRISDEHPLSGIEQINAKRSELARAVAIENSLEADIRLDRYVRAKLRRALEPIRRWNDRRKLKRRER